MQLVQRYLTGENANCIFLLLFFCILIKFVIPAMQHLLNTVTLKYIHKFKNEFTYFSKPLSEKFRLTFFSLPSDQSEHSRLSKGGV